MEELAKLAGAEYLIRPDNSHAKAGNINAALSRTEGDLVLMLDADHVPMPDALDAMVGYFDDERMALVQSPHDFFNHDSVQHYVVGRHEQSLFYRVVCPGKDRHGAAYWCGSAALIHRGALLEIGGVATETIAEDFHTTIRMQRHGWKSRYHDEVLVQGLAPHDLDGYLLQRDRWARGNLAVFTLPESPLRAKELKPLQRLSYFASLFAYLAPPMRLLLMATLGLVMWTGELPMKISVVALATLWLPYVTLNLGAGSALARGYMKIGETAHYELLTMEIYTRALRCIFRPGHTAFKVTPKQGTGGGGIESVRKLRLVIALRRRGRRRDRAAAARPRRGRAAARPAGDRSVGRTAARPDRDAPHPAHPLRRRQTPAAPPRLPLRGRCPGRVLLRRRPRQRSPDRRQRRRRRPRPRRAARGRRQTGDPAAARRCGGRRRTRSRHRSRCAHAAKPTGATWSAPRSPKSTRPRGCG